METEIKLAAPDATQVGELLGRAGFTVHVPRVFERNLVLDDETGSLRNSRRLLRLREAGSKITCTFKGPDVPGRHKQREEHEFTASGLNHALAVFQGLGYSVRFEYQKYRTEFARSNESGIATVDETPIGCFLELEGEASWIDRKASELGYTESDYITDSYGKLYTKWCAAQSIEPANMIFETR